MSLIDIDKVIDAIGKTGLDLGVKTELMTKVLNIPIEGAWHYPSKGEYPTENGEYWVAWRSPRTGQLMYGVGLWEIDRFLLNPQPKAWQYIVPPKEEA